MREPRAADEEAGSITGQAGRRNPFEIFIGLRVADCDHRASDFASADLRTSDSPRTVVNPT